MLRILPAPTSGWRVEGGYGEQPFVFPTKAQAISFFLRWAEEHQPCEVQIFSESGDLERILNFPNGNHRRSSESDRRRAQIDIPFPNRRRQERRSHA